MKDPDTKNKKAVKSQKSIHSRDIEDYRILKSD